MSPSTYFGLKFVESAPANSDSGSEEHIFEIKARWIVSCNGRGCKTHKSHFNFRSLVELLLPAPRYIDQPAGGNSHNEMSVVFYPIRFAIIRFTDQLLFALYIFDATKWKNSTIHTPNERTFWHVRPPLDVSVKLTLSYSILHYGIKESDERIFTVSSKPFFLFSQSSYVITENYNYKIMYSCEII